MKYEDTFIDRMKSELHAKYGVQIDSSIIVMMMEIKEQTEKDSLVLQKAADKLKVSQNVFPPANNWQALLRSMPPWGIPPIIISLITAILIASIYFSRPTSTYSKLNAVCDTVIIRNDSTFGFLKFGEVDKKGYLVNGNIKKGRVKREYRSGNDLNTEIYLGEK